MMNFKTLASKLNDRLKGIDEMEIEEQPESINEEFGFLKNNIQKILAVRGESVVNDNLSPEKLDQLFVIAQDDEDSRSNDARAFIKNELNIPEGEQAFTYQEPGDMKVTTVILNGTTSTSDEFESKAGALLNATGEVGSTDIHMAEDEFMKGNDAGWYDPLSTSEMREHIANKSSQSINQLFSETLHQDDLIKEEFGILKRNITEMTGSKGAVIEQQYGEKLTDLLMTATTFEIEGDKGQREENPLQPAAVKFLAEDLGLKDKELLIGFQHANVFENGEDVFYTIKTTPENFRAKEFDFELESFHFPETASLYTSGRLPLHEVKRVDDFYGNPDNQEEFKNKVRTDFTALGYKGGGMLKYQNGKLHYYTEKERNNLISFENDSILNTKADVKVNSAINKGTSEHIKTTGRNRGR